VSRCKNCRRSRRKNASVLAVGVLLIGKGAADHGHRSLIGGVSRNYTAVNGALNAKQRVAGSADPVKFHNCLHMLICMVLRAVRPGHTGVPFPERNVAAEHHPGSVQRRCFLR